ncbi:MAG: hypothetical protein LBT04_09960 [Prevotellaceae bacterium]|jgi:hypothetical protein|nr:hypothetical protein [Prevotellaceae bacterium]
MENLAEQIKICVQHLNELLEKGQKEHGLSVTIIYVGDGIHDKYDIDFHGTSTEIGVPRINHEQ